MSSDLPDRDRIQRAGIGPRRVGVEPPAGGRIVVATAYDLTGDRRYLEGVLEGLDHLFGRNALNLSYVTGWGEVWVENQHSRWYADRLNPATPNPPRGALSEGPDSSIRDPVTQRLLAGCPAQTRVVDDIGSWSTKEITIDWNASLLLASAMAVVRRRSEPSVS